MAKRGVKPKIPATIPLKQAWSAPPHLSEYAQQEFERVTELLRRRGALDLVDAELVVRRAELVEVARLAYEAIREEGISVISDRGNEAPHPAIKTHTHATAQLRLIDQQLGLVAPRPRSSASQVGVSAAYGDWSQYLGGKSS